jgi:hypothetical protein
MVSVWQSLPPVGRFAGAAASLLLLASTTGGIACQLCYEAARNMVTLGQQLDMADRAVVGVPIGAGDQFRVQDVVKGNDGVGEVVTEPVTGLDTSAPAGCDPCLLLHDPVARQWTGLGSVRAEYGDWLRQVAATLRVKGERPRTAWPRGAQPSSLLSDAGWRQRVALVLPYLESSDALVAQLAWGELARAPYATLGVARSRIDPAAIEGWLSDARLAARHRAYTLLLGFVGGPGDAARLEQRIQAAWNAHDATNLAAMIGADLELRGPSRVGWVEAMYFADRARTMPEIEAALLALKVHGEASGTVPRGRVIEAYRTFIGKRPPMAGFVAQQLADWDYWDATTEYAALLASDSVKDPASHFAIVNYLQRAAAAKAALR